MGKYCPIEDKEMAYLYCQDCDNKVCENTFFCLVVGSRSYDDYDFIKQKLDYLLSNYQNIVIVSGGAKGVDTCAKRYAQEKGYNYKEFPAEWDKYGNKAGYIRNAAMHVYLSKQQNRGCVAFWDGSSKGTKHNFGLAKKYNNPIKIVSVNAQKGDLQ